jgi:hypothetical protein
MSSWRGAYLSTGKITHFIYFYEPGEPSRYSDCLRAGRSDDRGLILGGGLRIFLFVTVSSPSLGATQSPVQWVQGALFLNIKLSGREADHSPPCSAEVKGCVELHLHPPPQYFLAWCLFKHRDNFTFYICFYKYRKNRTIFQQIIGPNFHWLTDWLTN